MVTGQTAGTTSATVTVQWTASTGIGITYDIEVTPNLPSAPEITVGTSVQLQDVPYNTDHTVSIVATNCPPPAAGSAAVVTVFNIGEFLGLFVDMHFYLNLHCLLGDCIYTCTHLTYMHSWLCCSSVTSKR